TRASRPPCSARRCTRASARAVSPVSAIRFCPPCATSSAGIRKRRRSDVAADVRICADASDLAFRVAEAGAAVIKEAVETNGRCSLAVSGGNTPRALYSRWAAGFTLEIPWAHVHLFWGDERFVPPDDPHSNFRMVRESLLDHVPIPAANVHPMPT